MMVGSFLSRKLDTSKKKRRLMQDAVSFRYV